MEKCPHCTHVLLWRCGRLICTNAMCAGDATLAEPENVVTLEPRPERDPQMHLGQLPDLAA
jgi:hypothetical protein